MKITVDHTQCGTADSVLFPFPFSITSSDLKTVPHGGNVTNANGYDIVIATDSAGASLVNWEVRSYDPVAGKVTFWIQLPTASHTTDQVLYLCFGNAAITTDQSNPIQTWSNGFVTVQHFDGDSTDATSIHNGGDTAITYSTGNGVLGKGAGFNGTSSQIALWDSINSNQLAPQSSSFSIRAWVNATSFGNAYNAIESNETSTTGHTLLVKSSGKLAIYISGHGGGATNVNYDGSGSNTLSTGTWYHLAFTYGQGNNTPSPLTGYVNGSQDATVSGGVFFIADAARNQLIGNSFYSSRFWNGAIDEYRCSNGVLTPSWILAEYNSQKPSSTFYSVGPTVLAAPTPPLQFLLP